MSTLVFDTGGRLPARSAPPSGPSPDIPQPGRWPLGAARRCTASVAILGGIALVLASRTRRTRAEAASQG